MAPSGPGRKVLERIRKRGVAGAERHILLCGDVEEAGCAGRKRMQRAWIHLKKRLRELDRDEAARLYRTRTYCMRLCAGGPIAVVHPNGIWYGRCDPPVLDRIIDEHLLGGRVVREFVIHDPDR